MNEMQNMWGRAGRGARIALVAGVLLIAALAVVAGRWALAKDYEALFTGLAEQDAAVMVAELERMKVPYRLEDGGRRILVPQELVHRTRLQLVGKNLPLHGAVGFEIFNNTDFGMTEFAQKVNYQRALQGELTRTIMSLDEVQAARVHLTMAETSMFKRDQNKAKASVTLTLKPGQQLAREQVAGIQRLIAAAVPGVDTGDVTVIDQKGLTLSSRRDGERDSTAWQLEMQRQIEDHLVRKAATMLDRTFGPGQGVVSVDVLLNFDQVKVTKEEVLPAAAAALNANGNATGVLVRERQTAREQAGKDKAEGAGAATVISSDTEYQAGRRVEQIVSTPGSVRRIHVGVVVPRGVAPERLARVREIVGMAVGLDSARGDGIAVYSLDQMAEAPAPSGAAADGAAAPRLVPVKPAVKSTANGEAEPAWMGAARYALVALLALAAALWWSLRRQAAPRPAGQLAPQSLPDVERARLLEQVKLWLDQPVPAAAGEETAR
jgi:flagellar M-ring protein FliF